MIKYLQRRYALSRKGAIDNIKGILCCALQNISFMLPACKRICPNRRDRRNGTKCTESLY